MSYLVSRTHHRIFPYTERLAASADMQPAADLTEARRLVEGDAMDDAFSVSTATKRELERFALERYGVAIDRRQKLGDLRQQVRRLQHGDDHGIET